MHAISITTLVGIVAFVVAKPHPLPKPLPQNAQAGPVFGHPGVATFNNYLRQKTSTCFPGGIPGEATTQQPFGAAAGDISPDVGLAISGGVTCVGSNTGSDQSLKSYDPNGNRCNGEGRANPSDIPNCSQIAPTCPSGNKAACYQVTSRGFLTPPSNGMSITLGSVIVHIIDSCAAGDPQNFCKASVPANQKCQDPGTNSLDIDQAAYQGLTGHSWVDGSPNIDIAIAPVACPGGSSTTS